MHEQVHKYTPPSRVSQSKKWYIHVHIQIHVYIIQHMNRTHVYTFPSMVIVHTTENANLSCSTDSVHVGISSGAHRYTVHTCIGIIIIIVTQCAHTCTKYKYVTHTWCSRCHMQWMIVYRDRPHWG